MKAVLPDTPPLRATVSPSVPVTYAGHRNAEVDGSAPSCNTEPEWRLEMYRSPEGSNAKSVGKSKPLVVVGDAEPLVSLTSAASESAVTESPKMLPAFCGRTDTAFG